MSGRMKVKSLQSNLESLSVFENPKVSFEQYHTPPRTAAEMLHAVDMDVGLSGKTVLDLGCGCGILGLGCVNRGALKVIGVDIDEDALKIAERNRIEVGLISDEISYLQKDVRCLQKGDLPDLSAFDIVVTNPPFGTRSKNIDQLFVEKGLEFSNVVYSIHKSSTRDFMVKKAKEMGVHIRFMLENEDFPIVATYKFHKFAKHFIKVDIIKFEKKKMDLCTCTCATHT